MTYDLVEGLGWETVREGYLNVKVRSKRLTSWQKLWCALRSCNKPPSESGSRSQAGKLRCMLSQYKSARDARDDLNCQARIDLRTAVDIEVASSGRRRKKFSFALHCMSAPRSGEGETSSLRATTHKFQCSSQGELDRWLDALYSYTDTKQPSTATYATVRRRAKKSWTGSMPNLAELGPMSRTSTSSMEVNELYQQSETTFPVEFEGSPSLPRIAAGPCLLQVTALFVNVYPSASKNAEPVRWPLDALRKYGNKGGQLYIESGRNCESGPGTFCFKTSESAAEYILMRIKFASKTLFAQSNRLLGDDSATAYVSSYSPAPGVARRVTRSLSANNIFRVSLTDSEGPYSTTHIRSSWLPRNVVNPPDFSHLTSLESSASTPAREDNPLPNYEPMYAVPKKRATSDTVQATQSSPSTPKKLSDPTPLSASCAPQHYEFLGANSQPGSASGSPTSTSRRTVLSIASHVSSGSSASSTAVSSPLSLSPASRGFLDVGSPSPPLSSRPFHLTKRGPHPSSPTTQQPELSSVTPAGKPAARPSSRPPSRQPSDTCKNAYTNIHMANGPSAINIGPFLRNRSESVPIDLDNTGESYHSLDHNSLVFEERYHLLKHPVPDRPMKGSSLSSDSSDGYNRLQTDEQDGYDHLQENERYYHLSDVEVYDVPTTEDGRVLACRPAVWTASNGSRVRSSSDSLPRRPKGRSSNQVPGKQLSESHLKISSAAGCGCKDSGSTDSTDSSARRRANAISSHARVASPQSSPKV